MKKYFVIIILFALACKHEPNPYIGYIERYATTRQIMQTNNNLFVQKVYDDVLENVLQYNRPNRVYYNYPYLLSVKNYADSINACLLQLKSDATGITHDSLIYNYADKTARISSDQIDTLKSQITRYNKWLVDFVCQKAPKGDTSKYRELIKDIKTHIPDWDKLPAFKGSRRNALEIYAVLTKLQNDVVILTSLELNFLASFVDGGCFRFIKLEPIVEANSQYIPLGTSYEAKLFLAHVDSTLENTTVIVDTMKATMNNSVFIYRERSTSKGTHTKNGYVRLENDLYNERIHLDIPFRLEYETVE